MFLEIVDRFPVAFKQNGRISLVVVIDICSNEGRAEKELQDVGQLPIPRLVAEGRQTTDVLSTMVVGFRLG